MQEPPQLIKPLRDETLQVTPAQNILFSWTMPAGALPGGKYKLRIVELFDGNRNPNDAFLSSPAFFEKEVTGNVYLMGPADPALVHGRSYAWAVQSTQDGETFYRNGGRSEIRAFKVNVLQFSSADLTAITAETPLDFSFLHLKGSIRYYWMTASTGSSPSLSSQLPTAVPVSAFSGFQGSALAGVSVHLVEALQFENPEFSSNYGSGTPFLPGNILPAYSGTAEGQQLRREPLATATTDQQGNFAFHFPALSTYDFSYKMTTIRQGGGEFQSTVSGRARKILMVKIGNPAASWYAQPVQFHATSSSEMGTFYARVKTFNPSIQVADKKNPALIKDGIEVIIVRKQPRPASVPLDEGQPGNFAAREKYGAGNYEVVAKGVTDQNGKVSFKNIVVYYCINYESPYLIFVRPKNEYSTSHSFKPTFPNGYPLRYAREQDYDGDCYNSSLYDLNESCYENNCFSGLSQAMGDQWSYPYASPAFSNFNRVPVSQWHPRIYAQVKNSAAGNLSNLAYSESGVSWFLWRINYPGAQAAEVIAGQWGAYRKWGALIETGSEGFFRIFAHLLEKNHPMVLERSGVTGSDGRIDAKDLPVEYYQNVQKGYFYVLTTSKSGFESKPNAVNRIFTTSGVAGDMNPALMGTAYNAGIQWIRPKGKVEIRLKGEDGPLISGKAFYIDPETGQTGNMVNLHANGEYTELLVPTGNQCKIVVFPTNFQKYQADTLQFTVQENTKKDLIVPLRIHRIHFKIKGALGQDLSGAKISLINIPSNAVTFYKNISSPHLYEGASSPVQHFPTNPPSQTPSVIPQMIGPADRITNSVGRADFAFSNSSSGPFTFRISGPQGESYVTLEKNVQSTRSKKWQIVEVQMKKGRTVTGKVTVGQSPIAQARVRVKGSQPLLETFTDQNGEYLLQAVPADSNLTFTASKGGSGLVGVEFTEGRTLDVKYGKISVAQTQPGTTRIDFNLKLYEDMDLSNLLGFPMEVTQLTESGSAIKVNALLSLPQTGWIKTDELLQIDNVTLIPDTKKNADQVAYVRPQTLPYDLGAPEMQTSVYQSFAGVLSELRLAQVGSTKSGVLQAKVGIRSVSFNDPNFLFTGAMFLKDGDQLRLTAFHSTAPWTYSQGLSPCQESGENFEYQLVYSGAFSATALPSGSRLYPDSLVLNTRIKAELQNMGTLNLSAGYISIGKDRKLNPFRNTVQHTQNLQAFKLDIRRVEGNASGIYLNGSVRALGLELPYQGATLFPDRIALNNLHLNQIKLPGNIPLHINTSARFGYEENPGRWYLAVLPSENSTYAARVQGQDLQGVGSGTNVDFSSLWFYSDGNKEMDLLPLSASLRYHQIADFYMQGVELTESTFALNGVMELGVPGLPAYQTGLMFGNSGASLRPFQMANALIKGVRLKFQQQSLSFTTGKIEVHGLLENENPEIFSGISFTLSKTAENMQVKIDEPPGRQKLLLGGQADSRILLSELRGKMSVEGGQWSTLKFTGNMPENMGFSPGSSTLNFEAIGGLQVNASTVKLKNMDTPFGALTMQYDLEKHRLLGQLNYSGNLASMEVEADIEFAVDRFGYYFLSAAQMEMSNPKVAGRGFLLMGDYEHKNSDRQAAIENVLKEYSYYYRFMHELPKGYQQMNRLNGFFMEAGAEIPFPVIPNFDVDLVVVSAKLEVTIGGDVRLGMNFGDVNAYTMGMSVFVNAEFGLGATIVVACAGVDLRARAGINMDGTYYSNDTFELDISGFINVSGSAYAGVGICDSDCDGPCIKSTASGSIGLAAIGKITNQNSSFELRIDTNSF